MLMNKKLSLGEFAGYVISQVIGAFAGAGLLKLIVSLGADSGLVDLTGGLGSNGVANIGVAGAIAVEIILTFIFIFTILGVTSDESKGGVAGIVIGLTLTFVHIVGIPLTGTSVNPARSIGPAVLAGGDALANVWVFIAAPLAGAALAAIVFKLLKPSKS
jgi:aquaporin Z